MVEGGIGKNQVIRTRRSGKKPERIRLNEPHRGDSKERQVFPHGIGQWSVPLHCRDIGASEGGELKADATGAGEEVQHPNGFKINPVAEDIE